ncbi:hypothetical protein Trydic_g14088 [Trypoxylus dichotomus]
MLRDHCSRDLTTVKIQWMHNSGTRDLLLGSAYLPYHQEGPPPTSEVKTLMSYAGAHKLQLLLGCDANARTALSGAAQAPINEVSHLSVTSSQTV